MTKFLVIGDVMVDHYRFGSATRISPEAPVPVILNPVEEFRPGGAANVAINLNQEPADSVTLVGLVADDLNGTILKDCVQAHGVKTFFFNTLEETITKERIICNNQQVARVDKEYISSEFDVTEYVIGSFGREFDCVVLSDYAKGCLANVEQLLKYFNSLEIPVFVDPKGQNFNKYKNAFALTPNEKEFENCTLYDSSLDLYDNMRRIRTQLSLDYLFVTKGKDGVVFVDRSDCISSARAQKVEVLDVTGAGDIFIAALVRGVLTGNSVSNSTQNAVDLATDSVRKIGTQKQEIIDVRHKEIKQKKIVFTNGCFDLLHAGHIDYLKKAKDLGDYLIVGVNSDSSVRALKGHNRPIVSQQERKLIIESLAVVDEVIIFDDETPEELIKRVKPDILVKGGDYLNKTIIGSDFVKSYGGRVEIIPIVHQQSTSNIAQKIKKG